VDVERSIQFHESHPSRKILFCIVRQHGHRLFRAYKIANSTVGCLGGVENSFAVGTGEGSGGVAHIKCYEMAMPQPDAMGVSMPLQGVAHG
jgi:hypothetical protein